MPQSAQKQSASLIGGEAQQEKLIVVAVSIAPSLSVMTMVLNNIYLNDKILEL